MFVLYSMLLWANLVFQGLLDTHSLLDNPFSRGARGYTHPCKFVLRSSVEALVKVTTSLLHHADTLPADASLLRPKPKAPDTSWHGSQASSQLNDGNEPGSQPYQPAAPDHSGLSERGAASLVKSETVSGINSNIIG